LGGNYAEKIFLTIGLILAFVLVHFKFELGAYIK